MPVIQPGIIISAMSGRCGDTIYATLPRKKGGGIDCWNAPPSPKAPKIKRGFRQLSRVAFRFADVAYSNMPKEKRRTWREAVKAPNTTAYTLWMKECMACILAFGMPPESPSPSGGYSTRYIQYGSTPFTKLVSCAELPFVDSLRNDRRRNTFACGPGWYSVVCWYGAVRFWHPGSAPYRWGQIPPGTKIKFTAEPVGYDNMQIDLPWLTETGWDTRAEMSAAISDRPTVIQVPDDTYGLHVTVEMPDSWYMFSDINTIVADAPDHGVNDAPWHA